jgi:dimeric dUTPase (all-alpha-NTP-PPase superfamily)
MSITRSVWKGNGTDTSKQVILNLLGNSLKFTMKGHVNVNIQYKRNMLITKVKDTGTGMNCNQTNIFALYEKVDSNLRINTSGAGLGLPICKKLTKLMGGTIKIKGTTVKFSIEECNIEKKIIQNLMNETILLERLPADSEECLVLESKEDLSLRIRKSITYSATRPYSDYWKVKEAMRVLVVDDDYSCGFTMKNYFKLRSMISDMAMPGKEAIEQAAKCQRYVLILIDLNIPDMSGIEATQQILQSKKN